MRNKIIVDISLNINILRFILLWLWLYCCSLCEDTWMITRVWWTVELKWFFFINVLQNLFYILHY